MSGRNGLRLVRSRAGRTGSPLPPGAAAGLLLLVVGLLTSLGGADRGRRPMDVTGTAREAALLSLEEGNDSPAVVHRLQELRRALGRTPVDAGHRAVYASLLLAVSRSLDDTRAASFHAARAAELAPVTVPVVRQSAMVLARCGLHDQALEIARRTCLFDAGAGVRILESLLPLIGTERAAGGLPEDPDAWLAWSRSLDARGDRREAMDRMAAAARRWPGHPRIVEFLAARSAVDDLPALFAHDLDIPREPVNALLFGFRAMARASRGRRDEAIGDVDTALALQGDNPAILRTCGDAWNLLGDGERAAGLWRRGLYRPSASSPEPVRVELLLRMARYEERNMRFRYALDYWRQILALRPDHREAGRRVDDLTRFRR